MRTATVTPDLQPATRAPRTGRLEGFGPVVWLWLATRLLLLALALFPQLYSGAVAGDVRTYGARVERMFQGAVLYRDVAIEYPPGSVPFTLLPGLVAGTGAGYLPAFAVEMLLVDLVGLAAACRLARTVDRTRGGDARLPRRRIPLAYVLAMAAVGPLALLRFDLVPAVCVLVAVALVAEGRAGWAAAALGYGAAAKVFPGVLLPLLVLGLVPALGWRRALRRTVPPFLLGLSVTVLPALLLSVRGSVDSILYHVRRGVQIESLWASGLQLAHLIGGLEARTVYAFGAYDLESSASELAKLLSVVATPVALAAAAWLVWRRSRQDGGLRPADWAGAFAIGVFAFVLPTRVLSPQYLVWLVAAAAGLALLTEGRRALALLAGAALLSQVIFPFRYSQLRDLVPLDVGLLAARNLLLVAACWLVVLAVARRRPPVDNGL